MQRLSDEQAGRVVTTGMSDSEVLDILQEARNPQERRATAAYELEHATRFSDDPRLKDEVFLVEQLMSIPDLYDPLRTGTTDPVELERAEHGRASRVGAPRMSGDIAPVAVAYLVGTKPEMQHYHGNHLQSKVWELSGFERTPGYVTFWNRLTEAERKHIPAWERASRYCWMVVRKHVPDAGLHWNIDATAYQSHVLAHHACLDPDACAAAGGKEMPKIIERAGTEEIEKERHDKQKEAPEDNADPLPLDGELTRETLLSELGDRLRDWDEDFEEAVLDDAYPQPELPKYRRKRPPKQKGEKLYKEIFIGDGPKDDPNTYKHRYEIRDLDAGFRIYRRGKQKFRQWLGGFAITITDTTTGCQIGQFHIPGDENEHTAYLDVLALGVRMTGRLPQNVITDKAYNTRRIRQINALLGIGQMSPWRKPRQTITKRSQMRRDTHDEYAIPTCHYCGGPGKTVGKNLGYELRKGTPVVRYRCAAPVTQACRNRLQRRPFELEWLLFGVVSREDPLYYELRGTGRPNEKAHQNSRTRTGQAGNNLTSRPKRVGIPFMAYRAAVGAFIDVFRLCLRYGWLGSHPKPREIVLRRRTGGDKAVASLHKRRAKIGLLLPRGKAAEKLGLLFQGLLPDGYKTIRQRKRAKAEAAKKAAAEKKAKQTKADKGKANPPPDPSAA